MYQQTYHNPKHPTNDLYNTANYNQRQSRFYQPHKQFKQPPITSDYLDKLVIKNNIKQNKFSFSKSVLNLNTSFTIIQTRHNIFEIGVINTTNKILDIISLGLNFIPNFNKIYLFYILYNFYISLNRLKNYSFFKLKDTNSCENTYSKKFKDKNISEFLTSEFPIQTKHLYSLNFLNSFRKQFLYNTKTLFTTKIKNHATNFNISCLKKTLTDIKNKQLTITKADKNIGIILINTFI